MEDLTEINDYKVVKALAKSKSRSTYIVVNKGLKNMSEDYFKILKLRVIDDDEITQDVETDLSIISSFEHPNIASYESFFFTKLNDKTHLATIRPYFKNCVSEVANFQNFTATDSEIMGKLISALSFVHDKYSMVLNLKKSNVFIDSVGELRITDLAIPVLFDIDLANKNNDVKACMYSAPEMKHQLVGINYKCDIWSLGVLMYELLKKAHPFDSSSSKEAIKLISKGADPAELGDDILSELIIMCLNVKSNQRPTLARINMMVQKLCKTEKIDFDQAEIRRTSYGLSSPNPNRNSYVGTEKLDNSSSHDGPKQLVPTPLDEKFYEIIKPDDFNNATYDTIVYNDPTGDDITDKKVRVKCLNSFKDAHQGRINGLIVLDNGLVVTSGDDKKINFWNPMKNELLAVVNEQSKVGQMLQFPKVKEFYYVIGSKIRSFDYSTGQINDIYEGLSNITCITRLEDSKNETIVVGLKDGTIEFVNRRQCKTYLSKPFHAGGSVVGLSAKNDLLISAGTDDTIVIYNIKSTILEQELNMGKDDFSNMSGVLKVGGDDKELIIADASYGITWTSYDIENTVKDYADMSHTPVVALFTNVSKDSNIFASSNDKGVVKVWQRVANETEDAVSIEIKQLRNFKAFKQPATAAAHFADGSIIIGGADGSYQIWSHRKDISVIGKVDSGSTGCCGTKCVIQ